MKLSGLRPSPIAIAGLIGLLWTVSSRALRDFIWADLREGMLDLRGLPPNPRRLARAGFAVLGLIIVTLLLGDFWRAHSPLVALTGHHVFRGQLLPLGLLPFTLFLLVIAWSFLLTGALHAHWAVRIFFLVVYELTAVGWANSVLGAGTQLDQALALAAMGAVLLLFIVRWRAAPRPVLEFAAFFLFISIVFLLAQRQELRTQALFGIPTGLAKISFNVNFVSGLITPLLLLIGLSIADFARRTSHWAGDLLTARTPGWIALVTLLALFGWRFFVALEETAAQAARLTRPEYFNGLLGGLGEVAVVALSFWLVRRRQRALPEEETVAEAVEGWGRPLVLTWSAVQLAAFVFIAFLMAAATSRAFAGVVAPLFAATDVLNGPVTVSWHILLSAGAWLGGVYLAGRKRGGELALYLAVFGAVQCWWEITARGRPLGHLQGGGHEAVELWWIAAVGAVAIWWTARRALAGDRVRQLVVLLLILSVIRQRDFIENPFSPIFGFAGIAFIAFSLCWDIATSGAWTNADTPRLPRTSRVFLYLGAVLLTATVLNWAVTIHDLDTVEKFTGGTALVGFDRFGKPLLYAAFALALFGSARPRVARRG